MYAVAMSEWPVAQGGPDNTWLIGLMLAFMVFYIILMTSSRRGEKEKARKRKEMLAALKKNDRIVTFSGIIGTIVNVKEDEIVVKVDETTNTKISIVRNAVHKVLADNEKPSLE